MLRCDERSLLQAAYLTWPFFQVTGYICKLLVKVSGTNIEIRRLAVLSAKQGSSTPIRRILQKRVILMHKEYLADDKEKQHGV